MWAWILKVAAWLFANRAEIVETGEAVYDLAGGKKSYKQVCPKCGGKQGDRKQVKDPDGVIRIHYFCPKCGLNMSR